MDQPIIHIRLHDNVLRDAQRQADEEDISLDELIEQAVVEKIEKLETHYRVDLVH